MKPGMLLGLTGLSVLGLAFASKKSEAATLPTSPSPEPSGPPPPTPAKPPPSTTKPKPKLDVSIGPATIEQSVQIPSDYRALGKTDLSELSGTLQEIAALGGAPGTLYPFNYQGRHLAAFIVESAGQRSAILLEKEAPIAAAGFFAPKVWRYFRLVESGKESPRTLYERGPVYMEKDAALREQFAMSEVAQRHNLLAVAQRFDWTGTGWVLG
jgi:hypothetical protein